MRKLSMVVQLSDPDDYEGGELEFFGVDDVSPERAHEHASTWDGHGLPLLRVPPGHAAAVGGRRSLVCWVGGPPFR